MGTGTVPARGAQIPRVPPAGDEETDKARYGGWLVGEGEPGDGGLRRAVTLPSLPNLRWRLAQSQVALSTLLGGMCT